MAMKDRLAQLRAVQDEIPAEEVTTTVTLQGLIQNVEESEKLDLFLSRCTKARSDLERLKECLEKMKNIHATILSKPESDKEFAEELRNLTSKFTAESKQLRTVAHELDIEANKTSDDKHCVANCRIKKEQSRLFSSSLFQLINSFNIEQENYKSKHLQGISKSLQIQGLTVSDEEVLSAIENGQIDVLTKGKMLAVADKTALFQEVQSRHAEIMALESGIRDLHELFHDIQQLVISQGEIVDNIEDHVDAAEEYVNKGQTNIKIIKRAQKRARKMKIYICILLLILAVILSFSLYPILCTIFRFG